MLQSLCVLSSLNPFTDKTAWSRHLNEVGRQVFESARRVCGGGGAKRSGSRGPEADARAWLLFCDERVAEGLEKSLLDCMQLPLSELWSLQNLPVLVASVFFDAPGQAKGHGDGARTRPALESLKREALGRLSGIVTAALSVQGFSGAPHVFG